MRVWFSRILRHPVRKRIGACFVFIKVCTVTHENLTSPVEKPRYVYVSTWLTAEPPKTRISRTCAAMPTWVVLGQTVTGWAFDLWNISHQKSHNFLLRQISGGGGDPAYNNIINNTRLTAQSRYAGIRMSPSRYFIGERMTKNQMECKTCKASIEYTWSDLRRKKQAG